MITASRADDYQHTAEELVGIERKGLSVFVLHQCFDMVAITMGELHSSKFSAVVRVHLLQTQVLKTDDIIAVWMRSGLTYAHMPLNLRVVTLNLLNDLTDWQLRAPLIVDELKALHPDLIALQEVALPDNTAQWIANQLGGYSLHLTPKTGGRGHREGLAILSRLPVEAHARFSFEHQGRVAQRVIVQYAGQPWIFANAHLYWHPIDDRTRRAEVQALIEWLPSPAILCGDFNAEPHSASISMVQQRFQSAYAAANGHEPDYTCPTPLYRGPAPRHPSRVSPRTGDFFRRAHAFHGMLCMRQAVAPHVTASTRN